MTQSRNYNHLGTGNQFNFENVGQVVVHAQHSRTRFEIDLLDAVETDVNCRLERSLHQLTRINLGKQVQSEQVDRLFDAYIKVGPKPAEPLAAEISILNVFERTDIAGKLLILGAPGAGKTTTMLDLAKALISKAKQDVYHPIPVLVELSAWKNAKQLMSDLLEEELISTYKISRKITREWIKNKQLLPLLDGLDEVKPSLQQPCIEAINKWLQGENAPRKILVCCRQEEYANSQNRLLLNGAIMLQALTYEQIQSYLLGIEQTEIWTYLQQDVNLLELVKTPLLLNVTIIAFNEVSMQQWQQTTDVDQRLKLLWDAYMQTMLIRPMSRKYGNRKRPDDEQTRYWLAFLAQQLQREGRPDFLVENMQPSWLLTEKQIRFYEWMNGPIDTRLLWFMPRQKDKLIRKINPVEVLNWSFCFTKKGAKSGSLWGAAFGALCGIALGSSLLYQNTHDDVMTIAALSIAIRSTFDAAQLYYFTLVLIECVLMLALPSGAMGAATGAIIGVLKGIKYSPLAIRRVPNQGMYKSMINSVVMGLAFGCVGGVTGLDMGLAAGGIAWYLYGGRALVQHYTLRCILYKAGYIPFDYVRFLNYCTERVILQRVGGSYRFIHPLFQDYFSVMQPKAKANDKQQLQDYLHTI